MSTISIYAADIRKNVSKGKESYNYWLYTPDKNMNDSVNAKKPLVIFLHGASLCGTNMDRVLRYGTLAAINKGLKLDSYVIAPQNPGGSWDPKKVMHVLKSELARHDDIDTTRLYVMGMSLGGFGAIDVAATYPDVFAAAMGLCGGATVKNLSNLNKIPLWIVHGIADRAVNISQSDRVVSAMRSADPKTPRLIYDRVPGMNHSEPARLFYMPDVYRWLFSHSLTDENRAVSKGFPVGLDALKGAYSSMKKGGPVTVNDWKDREKKGATAKHKVKTEPVAEEIVETIEEEIENTEEDTNP